MSIRLRLTLLYTGILAATLLLLGVTIYLTVANLSERGAADRLQRTARRLGAEPPQGSEPAPPTGADRGVNAREQLFETLAPDRTILSRSAGLGDAKLTISDAGWSAALAGREWTENQQLGEEPVLVAAAPIVRAGQTTGVVLVARSVAEQRQSQLLLGEILLAGGLVVLLLALGGGWLLAGAALRPIDAITQTVRAIELEQDLTRRVPNTGPRDEIGRLALTLNDMLAALQQAHAQTEAALQAQRRFVADASHELRTPLTTVRGNLALLQREPPIADDDRVAVIADSIDECERLSRLVGELLLLARADAGLTLATATVDLQQLAVATCRKLQPLVGDRRLDRPDGPPLLVSGNADAVTQVLTILLDNALKFTPPGGQIAVRVKAAAGCGAISVSDSGPGIAPDALPHLFERFFRADAARSGEGNGLGLAIADALTRALGGELRLESAAGSGSTFTLLLPLPTSLEKLDTVG